LKLKPLASLGRRKLRGLVVVGVMAAGVSGLVLQSTPAMADPIEQYVAVGSDTVQDVFNQFSADFGTYTAPSTANFAYSSGLLASYNATNPVTQAVGDDITPVDGSAFGVSAANQVASGGAGCAFVRPNGSGPGLAALEYSMGDHSVVGSLTAGDETPAQADFPGPGCVDIARSSSAPGGPTPATNPANESVQFIPFATDAVTGVTGPASGASGSETIDGITAPYVNTAITQADKFTSADLVALYDSCQEVTEGGVTYWPYDGKTGPAADQPVGTTRIDLYIPQLGSGTEKFWASKTGGWNAATPSSCVFHNIQNGPLSDSTHGGTGPTGGYAVEEHDGTAVSTDQYGYGPFSIAQYYAQSVNNVDPRYHAAVLHDINGITPFNSTGTLNTAFPFTRPVFAVVDQARITSTVNVTSGSTVIGTKPGTDFDAADFDAGLNALLVGSSSKICADKGTIQYYGFALYSSGAAGTPAGDLCGEVVPSNSENY
jgi:hypothetical protein